jgi:hypothetical protein
VTAAEKLVFTMRQRVIVEPDAPAGDGRATARQLDAVLMCAGFKCSRPLLERLAACDGGYVIDKAVTVIDWARELAGDHVRHNTYFIDFPANVPDTIDFWAGLLAEAARETARTGHSTVEAWLGPGGEFVLNLLTLPGYGRYQHTFEEMLAHHDELIPALTDRLTVLHPGGALADEMAELFAELAGSAVPLSGERLDALRFLAAMLPDAVIAEVPVRENLAVLNAARVRAGRMPVTGTPTDVLRLAAELSGADVTLARPPRFRSLPRPQRRLVLAALAQAADGRLGDVAAYAEQWKRLGEKLHPHESASDTVRAVFAVARGERSAGSLMSRAEAAFAAGDARAAAAVLSAAPGMLWRSADRLLRTAAPGDIDGLTARFAAAAPHVSGRVLLSVREHLQNRTAATEVPRIFANRKGRAWVLPDRRLPLDADAVRAMLAVVDGEMTRRLPDPGTLVIDPAILHAALPLSGKPAAEGLGVFPRGSVTPVEAGTVLRFFTYWRQRERRTDYDLSCVFTDEQFDADSIVAYTSLRNDVAEHSGDITEAPAPQGASEFINVHLDRIGRGYVIPQVYVFTGEGFDEVAENFFGYMTLDEERLGAPFEPRLVRAKSALHGGGKTAVPAVFYRGEDGRWFAKWLHLSLRGTAAWGGGIRVEENKLTVKILARSVLARDYLSVGYIAGLLRGKAESVTVLDGDDAGLPGTGPVTYLGLAEPESPLPAGSHLYTLANLATLIPA